MLDCAMQRGTTVSFSRDQRHKSNISLMLTLSSFRFAGTEAYDCNVEPKNNEGRLRKNLFCNYDKTSRPSLIDGPISVKIKLILKAFDFDHMTSKLTVSSWLAMVCAMGAIKRQCSLIFLLRSSISSCVTR